MSIRIPTFRLKTYTDRGVVVFLLLLAEDRLRLGVNPVTNFTCEL